jgi:hypothetical protein
MRVREIFEGVKLVAGVRAMVAEREKMFAERSALLA